MFYSQLSIGIGIAIVNKESFNKQYSWIQVVIRIATKLLFLTLRSIPQKSHQNPLITF